MNAFVGRARIFAFRMKNTKPLLHHLNPEVVREIHFIKEQRNPFKELLVLIVLEKMIDLRVLKGNLLKSRRILMIKLKSSIVT